ncbi:hypothetical protein BESB_005260 [Besnoitia besnoiti]|uniref:Adaptor-related protein complex 5 beta subunit n=1 Tax=Besnoitia besnoiti TaxID=94643 RepID=A0A2A9MJP0_BESBE|nr:hypothetical protein BESB_005260 [Besnoitia besnoiti]PFH38185.1 hypothetical protein BESB_005260 [Besnoitia besnoiti]
MSTASGFVPSLLGVLEGLAAALQHQHRSAGAASDRRASQTTTADVSAMLKHLHAFLLTNIFTPALIADASHNASAAYLRCLIHRVQLDLYALLVSSAEFASLSTRLLASMLIKLLASISPSSPPRLFSTSSTALPAGATRLPPYPPASASRAFSDRLFSASALTQLSPLVVFDVEIEGQRAVRPRPGDAAEPLRGVPGALGSTGAVGLSPASGGGPGPSLPQAFGQLPAFFFTTFGGNMALYSPHQLRSFLFLLAELKPADLLVANAQNFVAWLTFSPADAVEDASLGPGAERRRGLGSALAGLVPGDLNEEEDDEDDSYLYGEGELQAGSKGGGAHRAQLLQKLAQGENGEAQSTRYTLFKLSSGAGSSAFSAISTRHRPSSFSASRSGPDSSSAGLAAPASSSSSILTSLFPSSTAAPFDALQGGSRAPASAFCASSAAPDGQSVFGLGGKAAARAPDSKEPDLLRLSSPQLAREAINRGPLRASTSSPVAASAAASPANPAAGKGFFIFPPPVGYDGPRAKALVASSSSASRTPPVPPLALRQLSLSCLLVLLERCFCSSEDVFSVAGRHRDILCAPRDEEESECALGRGECSHLSRAEDGRAGVPPDCLPGAQSAFSQGQETAGEAGGARRCMYTSGVERGDWEGDADASPAPRALDLSAGPALARRRRCQKDWWFLTLRRLIRRVENWGIRLLLNAQRDAQRQEDEGRWSLLKNLWRGDKPKVVLEADGKPSREMFTCLCVVEDFSDEQQMSIHFFSALYAWLVTIYHRQITLQRQKQIGEEAVFKLVHFGFLPRSALAPPATPAYAAVPPRSRESVSPSIRSARFSAAREDAEIEEGEEDAEEESEGDDERREGAGAIEAGHDAKDVQDMVQRLLEITKSFDAERGVLARMHTAEAAPDGPEGVPEREASGKSQTIEPDGDPRGPADWGRPSPSHEPYLDRRLEAGAEPRDLARDFVASTRAASAVPPPNAPRCRSLSPCFASCHSATSSYSSSASGLPSVSKSVSSSVAASVAEAAVSTCVAPRAPASIQLNRRFLSALATYCLRLLAQVERQQNLYFQQLLQLRERAEKAAAASALGGSSLQPWSFLARPAASKSRKREKRGAEFLARLLTAAGAENDDERQELRSASLFARAALSAGLGRGGALAGTEGWAEATSGGKGERVNGRGGQTRSPFTDGVVKVGGSQYWSLGQHAAIPESVWELQMADAVGAEAMRILDLVCRADAEYVSAVFPAIKRVCERLLSGGGLHLFTCVFHFYLHHYPHQLFSLDSFVQQYVAHLGLHYRSVLLTINALTFLNNNLQALVVKTNIFTRYFPVIFKLVAYHPRAAGSLLFPLLPAIVGPDTVMEVLHSLLDLPLTASFLERFDQEGAAAASLFASSFFASSKEVSAGALSLAAQAAATACDRTCPFLKALKAYLLRNEAGGRSVIWESDESEEVLVNLQVLWRRLPITSRLSAVCKIVPGCLQVYFRIVLNDAPPYYAEKVLRVLLERFLMLCPVEFYMDALNRLFLTMILQIFNRYPIFVISLRTQILQAVYRHLTVRGALLARHLCWVMGEYASPHLLTPSELSRWERPCAAEPEASGFSALRNLQGAHAGEAASSLPVVVRRAASSKTGAELFAGFFDALESLAYEATASVRPASSTLAFGSSPAGGSGDPLSFSRPARGGPLPPSSPSAFWRLRAGAAGSGALGAAPARAEGVAGVSPPGATGAEDAARLGREGEAWGQSASAPNGPGRPEESARGTRDGSRHDANLGVSSEEEDEETDSEDMSELDTSDELSLSSDEEREREEGRRRGESATLSSLPADAQTAPDQEELRLVFTPCFVCVVVTAMTKFALRYPAFMPRVVLCFSKLSRCFSSGEYASVRERVQTCLHLASKSSACASILQARVPSPIASLGPPPVSFDADGIERVCVFCSLNSVRIAPLQSLTQYCHTPYNFVPGPRLHLFELPGYPVDGTPDSQEIESRMAQYLFADHPQGVRQTRHMRISPYSGALPEAEVFALQDQGLASSPGEVTASLGGSPGNDTLPQRGVSPGMSSLAQNISASWDMASHEHTVTWEHARKSMAFVDDSGGLWSPLTSRPGGEEAADEGIPGSLFSQPSVTEMLLRRQIHQKDSVHD